MRHLRFGPATLIVAIFFACSTATDKTETRETTAYEIFGEEITPDGALTGAEFLAQMAGKDSMQVKLKAEIEEVCQKKGCWMDLDISDELSLTVRFKDYGFFVPKDADGRIAIVEGWAKKDTTSVELLRHYAEDAGKSQEEIEAITEPEIGYTFEAHGVIILPRED